MDNEKSFDPVTVQKIFKQKWKHENTKISKDALALSCEFLHLFVMEAIHRSSEEQEVMLTHSDKIEPEHLERILPQLLLDF